MEVTESEGPGYQINNNNSSGYSHIDVSRLHR
jgi:hypothetical protein